MTVIQGFAHQVSSRLFGSRTDGLVNNGSHESY